MKAGEDTDIAMSPGTPGLPEAWRGKERFSPGDLRRSAAL